MSSPSINRWGLNLFWYRFWYADKNNSSLIAQDDLINKLVSTYVNHGLIYNQNIYLNRYWWPFLNNTIQSYNKDVCLKYFRAVEYKNRVTNEIRFYSLRNKIKNLYFSKIWIFRYQNWLLINFYAYQPLKKSKKARLTKNKTLDFYLTGQSSDKNKIYYRIKFYLFFLLHNSINVNNYYNF